MRVAFYAPLKSPRHGTPSGDRRVARLLIDALALAGHAVELASEFRSYDGTGDAARQQALRLEGEALAARLIAQWRAARPGQRPELWFTYHLYYKAPDWLGPLVAEALAIPYVAAEASYAPKRAEGRWEIGHQATAQALHGAALVLCPSRDDLACLEPLVAKERLALLPPFLDPAPYRMARLNRSAFRSRISQDFALDASVPWIMAAAMMRDGDKLASYRMLAGSLARLADLPWQLLVAGDGPAREKVQAALAPLKARIRFFNELNPQELAAAYAACDLYVWPAVNEAYGMALLEAQAAGLPVVSCALRGVPDVVVDGRTGLLAPTLDEAALAERVRALLVDGTRREALGREAARFVAEERSVAVAAQRLTFAPGTLP